MIGISTEFTKQFPSTFISGMVFLTTNPTSSSPSKRSEITRLSRFVFTKFRFVTRDGLIPIRSILRRKVLMHTLCVKPPLVRSLIPFQIPTHGLRFSRMRVCTCCLIPGFRGVAVVASGVSTRRQSFFRRIQLSSPPPKTIAIRLSSSFGSGMPPLGVTTINSLPNVGTC